MDGAAHQKLLYSAERKKRKNLKDAGHKLDQNTWVVGRGVKYNDARSQPTCDELETEPVRFGACQNVRVCRVWCVCGLCAALPEWRVGRVALLYTIQLFTFTIL